MSGRRTVPADSPTPAHGNDRPLLWDRRRYILVRADRPDNLFCRDGVLQETGIIEHIAQSAAARVGYIYMLRKEPVPLGFIGSVEKMKLFRLPSAGAELYTGITIVQEVFDITLITAEVKENDELLAECRMKIYLKKE